MPSPRSCDPGTKCPQCSDTTRWLWGVAGLCYSCFWKPITERKRATRLRNATQTGRRAKPVEERIRAAAARFVYIAIECGYLPKLDGTIACVDCGRPACDYEHRDYARPLDVEPCCRSCNQRRGSAGLTLPVFGAAPDGKAA